MDSKPTLYIIMLLYPITLSIPVPGLPWLKTSGCSEFCWTTGWFCDNNKWGLGWDHKVYIHLKLEVKFQDSAFLQHAFLDGFCCFQMHWMDMIALDRCRLAWVFHNISTFAILLLVLVFIFPQCISKIIIAFIIVESTGGFQKVLIALFNFF